MKSAAPPASPCSAPWPPAPPPAPSPPPPPSPHPSCSTPPPTATPPPPGPPPPFSPPARCSPPCSTAPAAPTPPTSPPPCPPDDRDPATTDATRDRDDHTHALPGRSHPAPAGHRLISPDPKRAAPGPAARTKAYRPSMLMPVPPGRDSRATSSLRIDQQPATTSALVTKRVKPANINCRETGLRSLVTNNCGHPRTKSEVSPKIPFYGRLHVIAYRATPDVPREVAWFLAKLLAAERQRRGPPRGSRALTCFWQAVLGLRRFRDRTAADALARDHGISRATAYRYLDEVVIVLAQQAPDLREALERAKDNGFSHLILDGKIIPCDRC